jgi:hypothetical protein
MPPIKIYETLQQSQNTGDYAQGAPAGRDDLGDFFKKDDEQMSKKDG